ncbi:hypothetical protein ABT095_20625 [Kitasatospora sp. NPDC002227]|uniref:hypothetical protein n=1 Tax=Kitasatospora sp. NPDC002227 TaxID=3154773 RepID=UPI00332D1743
MPDREAAPRRRRRGSSSPNLAHTPAPGATYDSLTHLDGAHGMGIPRIIGRRARWVGARLRREG